MVKEKDVKIFLGSQSASEGLSLFWISRNTYFRTTF